jgi:hypothetical protein
MSDDNKKLNGTGEQDLKKLSTIDPDPTEPGGSMTSHKPKPKGSLAEAETIGDPRTSKA